MTNSQIHPLHQCNVHKQRAILNRTYILFHIITLVAIFYYRTIFFYHKNNHNKYFVRVPMLPWIVIFAAEIMLSFMWILRQPFYWRPLTRTVFPEKLPKDEDLPRLDVFICTTDPNREPTFKVMNTVVSAMCLDYPSQNLSVYMSDDGGASVTLDGMKAAWVFATWWVPFCKRYNFKQICPQVFFEGSQEVISQSMEFIEDRNIIKDKYESFKQRVLNWKEKGESDAKRNAFDHPALVQVLWSGMDGLQGSTLSGSNFYIKRKALFGTDINDNHGNDIKELKEIFGPSNNFLNALSNNSKPDANQEKEQQFSPDYLQDAQSLASCTYEKSTQWGKKIGFNYESCGGRCDDFFYATKQRMEVRLLESIKASVLRFGDNEFGSSTDSSLQMDCRASSAWSVQVLSSISQSFKNANFSADVVLVDFILVP